MYVSTLPLLVKSTLFRLCFGLLMILVTADVLFVRNVLWQMSSAS